MLVGLICALLSTLQSVAFGADRPLSPNLEVNAGENIVVDTVRNFSVRVTQPEPSQPADKDDPKSVGTVPIRDHEITIPAWRFAIASVTPSDFASCSELRNFGSAASHMEAVGTALVKVQNDDTRDPGPFIQTNRSTSTFEYQDPGPGPAIYTTGGAALWFRKWVPDPNDQTTGTAYLCGQVTTSNPRIPKANREIVFDVKLQLQSNGSWIMSFNLDQASGPPAANPESVTDNPYFTQRHVSITEVRLTFSGLSGGNWNLRPDGTHCTVPAGASGATPWSGYYAPCQVAFSRSPHTPANYTLRGEFSVCPPAQADCPRESVIREVAMPVASGLSPLIHPFGTFTGPRGPSPVDQPFSLITGTNEVMFSWQQPSVFPRERIKGYLLVIAIPGDQDSRHMEHLITDPHRADFDKREPCGSEGSNPACSLKVTFPLNSLGGKLLDRDGKYDAALVTVISSSDSPSDHRSDGLCDDGSLDGVRCPVDEPTFRTEKPGVSILEFMIRSERWPLAFAVVRSYTATGGGPTTIAPDVVLLVDFALQRAEIVKWKLWAPYLVYSASSNAIRGSNDTGGIVSFGNSALLGNVPNWRFDGEVDTATGQGSGSFAIIDWKGLPGTPNATPTVDRDFYCPACGSSTLKRINTSS